MEKAREVAFARGGGGQSAVRRRWTQFSPPRRNRKRSSAGTAPTPCRSGPSLDMYSHAPEYEYPPYTSWPGCVLTALTVSIMAFYVAFTLRDYILKEPELVQRGSVPVPQEADVLTFPIPVPLCLSVEYRDVAANGTARHVRASNDDRYFRYEFNHVTVSGQQRSKGRVVALPVVDRLVTDDDVMLCLDPSAAAGLSEFRLQGEFSSDVYQYVELAVKDCLGPQCASEADIRAVEAEWVKVQILVGQEVFDISDYHRVRTRRTNREKRGVLRGEDVLRRMYLISGYTLKHEVYMQGRQIQHEKEHLGSPPVPESMSTLLSFFRISSLIAPPDTWTGRNIEFFVRLFPTISQEETEYWMPSILDLFGLWGALAAFLTEMSFGLVGRRLNRWLSRRSFRAQIHKFRVMNNAAAKWQRWSSRMDGLDAMYDARTIPDLRLFDADHFNDRGMLNVSPEEFRIPTSVYGELRSFAVEQHEKRNRAALKLSAFIRSKSKRSALAATTRPDSPSLPASFVEGDGSGSGSRDSFRDNY